MRTTRVFTELNKIKKAKSQAKKPVTVVRLTKKGEPSKLAEDTHKFDNEAEAYAYIRRIEELNPGTNYTYQVTTK